MFAHFDSKLVDLLRDMLQFNPYLRITAKEALKSKIFDKIRRPVFEQPAKAKIQMDDDIDNYDYDAYKGKHTI